MSPRAGWLLLALLLAGCGGAAPPVRDRFFELAPTPATTPVTPAVPGTLLVNALGTRGLLGGSQITFRTSADPLAVQRYDDLLWQDLPGRALAGHLVDALRAAGLFQFVVTVTDRASADWLLGGELTRLEHLPTDQPPRVACAFNLSLVGGRERRVLFSGSYGGEETVTGDGPEAMAASFNRLLGRLLADAVADLTAATRQLGLR